jgi:hypothetical protein
MSRSLSFAHLFDEAEAEVEVEAEGEDEDEDEGEEGQVEGC